jgi:hypothetical protein
LSRQKKIKNLKKMGVCIGLGLSTGARYFVRTKKINNRTRLEETTDPTPHGDQRLHVQQ